MEDTGVWYDDSAEKYSAKFRFASRNKVTYYFKDNYSSTLGPGFFGWDRKSKRQLAYIELTEW